MTVINFYQISPAIYEKTICQLLEKCYKSDYRTIVKVSNEEVQESLNKSLWTFAQKSFIPHGSKNDPQSELQPVYITTSTENPNNANVLVLVGNLEGLYDNFERIFIIFDGNQEGLKAQINGAIKKLKTSKNQITYHEQKNDGGWITKDLNN